jgi:hypothetical protein
MFAPGGQFRGSFRALQIASLAAIIAEEFALPPVAFGSFFTYNFLLRRPR